MIVYKYDHTHLTSRNPEEVVDFFIKVLGATVAQELTLSGGRGWDLDVGGLLVRISSNTGADAALKKETPEKSWFGLHHLALNVSNLSEAAKDLVSKGVEFVVEPQSGSRFLFIRTRGNVLIEIIEKR